MVKTEHGDPVNDCYRILKNNEILGQVLKNKYGSLEKKRIGEIIETIADGGLRLVNFVLKDEKEIVDCARYLHEKYPTGDINKIRDFLQIFSFFWTMINVNHIDASPAQYARHRGTGGAADSNVPA